MEVKSKKIEAYGIKFDSLIEKQTYELLLQYFSSHQIHTHHKVLLFDENEFFPAYYWNIDFYISPFNLFIECKGLWSQGTNDKCRADLRAIAATNDSILRGLIFVSATANQKVSRKHKTLDLDSLNKFLKEYTKRYNG